MTFAEFLETFSLYRKAKFDRTFNQADPLYSGHQAIHTYCGECKTDRTFNYEESPRLFHNQVRISEDLPAPIVPEYNPFAGGHNHKSKWDFIFYICYRCGFCKKFERVYFVWSSADGKTVMKVGQFPAVDIAISKDFKQILQQHEETYKKGLICESHGFGIGAFAYYRRIVESVIDQLLDAIESLLIGTEKEKYQKGLAETKKTIVAQQKIELVKDLLPASLRPQQMNPLDVLHGSLSEGIHSLPDAECLSRAEDIRNTLAILVNLINVNRETQKVLTESMRRVMESRGKPKEDK